MSNETHELINAIGNIYGELYKVNKNIESLYQSPFQKYLPSIISIIAVGGSFGIAYYTSKWSYANQLSLEKIKREADTKEKNKKMFGDVYSRVELITSYIKEVNIEYINVMMYANLLLRPETNNVDRGHFEKFVFDGKNRYNSAYENYTRYKSELANIIGQIHYDSTDVKIISELNKINNENIFLDIKDSIFNGLDFEGYLTVRGSLLEKLNTFINTDITPRYQTFIFSVQKKLNT